MINCITFSKILTEDIEKTIFYFYEKKGMRTCLTQMCHTGEAIKHPEWIPNSKEIQKACQIRDKINYPNTSVSIGPMDVNKFYCGGIICITIKGNVTPCSVIRESYGNIHEKSIQCIIKQHKKELLFMDLRNNKSHSSICTSCEHNSVCWGCRAVAYYSHGDICGFDPNCYKKLHSSHK